MKAMWVMKIWMVISTMKGKVMILQPQMILQWIGQETMTGLEKMLPCLRNHTSHQSRLSCFSVGTEMDMTCIQTQIMWPGWWIIILRLKYWVRLAVNSIRHESEFKTSRSQGVNFLNAFEPITGGIKQSSCEEMYIWRKNLRRNGEPNKGKLQRKLKEAELKQVAEGRRILGVASRKLVLLLMGYWNIFKWMCRLLGSIRTRYHWHCAGKRMDSVHQLTWKPVGNGCIAAASTPYCCY